MIHTYNRNTIVLFITLVVLGYFGYKSLKEGFYLSFFPYCSNHPRTTIVDDHSIKPTNLEWTMDKEIIFKFPKDTSREQMITYIGNFFNSKINGVYKNTLFIKFERKGENSSDFYPIDFNYKNKKKISDADYSMVNLIIGYNDTNKYKFSHYGIAERTKYITTPQVNRITKYPLEFLENSSVKIDIKKEITPIPVLYFMHYYFDDFYCRGKMEKTLNVSGANLKDNISKHVVEVGNIEDCLWGRDNSKVQNCRIQTDPELIPDDISVEPDNVISNYQTPSLKLNRCNVKNVYFKKWDARGVPIENLENNLKMKEFLPHPALFQNKLDGLYDDVFDMSRIIPSFPTGRTRVGR